MTDYQSSNVLLRLLKQRPSCDKEGNGARTSNALLRTRSVDRFEGKVIFIKSKLKLTEGEFHIAQTTGQFFKT